MTFDFICLLTARLHRPNTGHFQKVAIIILVLAVFAALSLSACASSVLVVEQPYPRQEKSIAATVEFDNGGVPINNDNRAYTQEKLEQELFMGDSPIFAKGDGLTVKWRYVGFNEGSRLGRYLTGGIGGGSKVVLEVDFINQSGEILTTVRGEGSVGEGFSVARTRRALIRPPATLRITPPLTCADIGS